MKRKHPRNKHAIHKKVKNPLPFQYQSSTTGSNKQRLALQIAGTPGYLLTAFAWACLVGGLCYWLLRQIPMSTTGSGPSTSPAAPISATAVVTSGSITDSGVLPGYVQWVLGGILLVAFFVGFVYVAQSVLHGAATAINRLVESIGSSRFDLYKIGLLVIGWGAIAGLSWSVWPELAEPITIGALASIAIGGLSFCIEYSLARAWHLDIDTVWDI